MTDSRPNGVNDRLLRGFLTGDRASTRRIEGWASEHVRRKLSGLPREDREDIVQETLVGLHRAVTHSGFSLRTTLRGLVKKIAVARCIDYLRRRRPVVDLDPDMPDPHGSPYDEILRKEQGARLRWILQNLKERCKELIRLFYFEERPYSQIALKLGAVENTLRGQMFRCMQQIRSSLRRWAGTS